ncbi:MAG: hypothetical protein V3U51_03930 [Thermoplasmata archaeon]
MLRRILMFGTALVLLALVLLTPLFLERGGSLGAIPRLLIDHAEGETRIYVEGAVETTRYPYVTVDVMDISGNNWNSSDTSYNTIGMTVIIQDVDSTHFQLNITIMVGDDILEYGCEVEIGEDIDDGETINVLLPDREEPIITTEDSFPYRDVISQEVES